MNYQHALAVRSYFSMGEALMAPKQIPTLMKAAGYKSVALVDTMSINGLVDFCTCAEKEGVKPIVGVRLKIVPDPTLREKSVSKKEARANGPWYPKVYARNHAGVQDIMKLLSRSYQEDRFYIEPRLGLEDLLPALARGNLAVSSGDFYSVLHREDCRELLLKMRTAAAGCAFVEIVPINTPLFDRLNERGIELARELEMDTVLTMPVLYESAEDADARDVMAAIVANGKMDSPARHIPYMRDLTVKAPLEVGRCGVALAARLKRWTTLENPSGAIAGAIAGMQKLVDACSFEWKKQAISLPAMAENEQARLVAECKIGWKERLSKPTMGYMPSPADIPKYLERLKYELGVLNRMGFERYFLVVQELVQWSKRNGITVGPGRGSVGGSLVAYLLGITDVDPIRFNLIFERFINPERLDLPDADLDFMSSRRGEVIQHLVEKYGAERVAGISNYTTMGAASALRDTGRVFGLSKFDIECSKYIPKDTDLVPACETVPELEKFREAHREVWDHAVRLEGKLRSLGQHAAGVVIAGEPIINRATLIQRSSDLPVVNWDKRVVEDWGLVKIDILGLSTLDLLTCAKSMIQARHGVTIDFIQLPLDDKDVMKAFGQGDTVGVFQFESSGMRKLLKDLAVGGDLTFDDLVAATALYRPGPMQSGLLDDFVSIRQGMNAPHYEHPNMKAALESTQGVIVYQEQVMQLAVDLAGFTHAESDHMRKAMGKKDADKMAEMREKWVSGCKSHSGMDERRARDIFDKIEKFAGYAFNLSHSVEYAIISYLAMWIKVKYPPEFYAASLSVMKEEKLTEIVKDAERRNVFVAPPDINLSGPDFEIHADPAGNPLLVAPFNRLKGASDKTADAILEARKRIGRPFTSKEDFLANVNKRNVNVRVQEALERVGAFASVTAGSLPARHPDRLKDQMELLPGLVVELLKADRKIDISPYIKGEIVKLANEVRSCEKCSLQGNAHPLPRMGKSPKFMVVTDCPNWAEEKAGKMMEGDAATFVKSAIKEAGLSVGDGYFTALVRSPKVDKQLTNEQINGCCGYLDREVGLLKPPVIVALGGAAIRHFVPDVKGGYADLCGQVHYLPKLDASVIFGISPLMCHFDGSKQKMLDDLFAKVAEMVL
ncbi:DNA polymerase III subunit alpha [Ectothiorhodospira shaposhnikovii]|uniref:DNA polymerase III subunit alpha n=1 Tax=Ectothiorhodospira shaposhnikovii TaxID=1054 RepID=UPI001EE7C0CD|nr:DNA polymerase III subunit alpha [Ectothiorhodospira shaposhnikovii]MCG5512780.1 DNA polymerase III subunit alpha [Ectothiorhodospira shaposhnikovii]